MVKWTPPLTRNQQIAIAILPKFTASLSMIGSAFILQHVLLSPKRRQLCYHRILLGLSAMDLVSSFKSFLSTWILPTATGAWGAAGTVGTCAAAGFFGQGSSIASPLYNGSLASFYLLTVKYGWRDDPSGAYDGVRGGRFQRVEPWMHAIPLSFGWGTAVAGLPLRLYNPIGWTCWIAEVPRGCDGDPSVPCARGDHSYIYRWAFFHAELWFTFVAIAAMMVAMYRSVRERERRSQQSRVSASYSRRVMTQALLYVLAYFITWIFPAVTWLSQALGGKTYTPILMLQAFIVPLQGFFNAFIYLRPRYLRNRRTMPDARPLRVVLTTLTEGRRGQLRRREADRNGRRGQLRRREADRNVAVGEGDGGQGNLWEDCDSDFPSLHESDRGSFIARFVSMRRSFSRSFKRRSKDNVDHGGGVGVIPEEGGMSEEKEEQVDQRREGSSIDRHGDCANLEEGGMSKEKGEEGNQKEEEGCNGAPTTPTFNLHL
ncbi:hypothetical protein ACHAWF_017409 [Thalassiosira exigua]